ncbi:MAG: prepilin-type N-terminal cleavage/methylation domain-containing protein [Sphingobacteriia bacterium]|nr:prepilin-type N-terminal cleavage/methylation domain-containing protein [Sphingobacteriia bacterium]NCC38670.1 prepilin-type N-terminal cleavage/methylation domain-containing protein [Gammaproteobacteria bacterium]
MKRDRLQRAQRGFSLLEVLVAFAILAISLGVLMQIFSQAARATVLSAQYSRAASLAESKLNGIDVLDVTLAEGVLSGEPEDGMAWEISITALTLGDEFGAAEPLMRPYRVTATVLWQDGEQARRVTLSTLRLGESF